MVTREQILWAYRVILGRDPESETEYAWHSQYNDFDELRRNIICSDEGTAHLRRQLGPSESDQTYQSIVDCPSGTKITTGIAYFSGFVQSSAPLPPIKIVFDTKAQAWVKTWSTSDSGAPWDRRFTTHWSFRREVPVEKSFSRRKIVLEAFAGDKLVGSHKLILQRRRIFGLKRRRPLIYFIHVEKTAGTSLRSIIEREKVSGISVYNHIDFVPEEICRTFSRSAFNEIDVVFGHFPFGLHRNFDRPYKYASMIRRPLDIAISYYLFVKYVSDETKFDSCADIFEAIDIVKDRVFDNILVRYFSGRFDVTEAVGESDYLAAVENIENEFCFIGLSEEFDRCAPTICAKLGIRFAPSFENKTPPTDEANTIDKNRLQKHLGGRIVWDMRLYDLLAERWSVPS